MSWWWEREKKGTDGVGARARRQPSHAQIPFGRPTRAAAAAGRVQSPAVSFERGTHSPIGEPLDFCASGDDTSPFLIILASGVDRAQALFSSQKNS